MSTFATYNIWRSYAVEFKVELSCVEEDMTFECEDEQAVPIVLIRDGNSSYQVQRSHQPLPPAVGPQPQISPYQPQPQFAMFQGPSPAHSQLQGPGRPPQDQQPGYFQPAQAYSYPQNATTYNLQRVPSSHNHSSNQYQCQYHHMPQEDFHPSQGHVGGEKRDVGDIQ